jgi:hypothetical protein
MPKTKRDLLYAVADKIVGERGERMRSALKKKTPFDDIIDRPMSDEAFDAEKKKLESELPQAFEKMNKVDWEKPGTWGQSN